MVRAVTKDLVVLTGAPGTGKSAILDRLRGDIACVDEPAREILAEQRASGGSGTWDQDAALFVRLLLERSIETFEAARASGRPVLFDRGIPDCVVYASRAGVDAKRCVDAVEAFRYAPRVFFLEPWQEIYSTDAERTMSFEETVSFDAALREVYERSGYELVEVPRSALEDRVAFVRTFLS